MFICLASGGDDSSNHTTRTRFSYWRVLFDMTETDEYGEGTGLQCFS